MIFFSRCCHVHQLYPYPTKQVSMATLIRQMGGQETIGNCFELMHSSTKLTFIKTLKHINHHFSPHQGCVPSSQNHIDVAVCREPGRSSFSDYAKWEHFISCGRGERTGKCKHPSGLKCKRLCSFLGKMHPNGAHLGSVTSLFLRHYRLRVVLSLRNAPVQNRQEKKCPNVPSGQIFYG